jgi:hypothetical protein
MSEVTIVEPEKTSVAIQCLCKHVWKNQITRQSQEKTRNSRGTAGGGVLSWVCGDAIVLAYDNEW